MNLCAGETGGRDDMVPGEAKSVEIEGDELFSRKYESRNEDALRYSIFCSMASMRDTCGMIVRRMDHRKGQNGGRCVSMNELKH